MLQYPCPWLKGLLLEALKEADFRDYVGFVEVSWRFRVFIRLQALSKACLFKVLPSSGALNFVSE